MRSLFSSIDPFALPTHGGDLAAADARFGRPAAGWLDLSTGISPFPYPLPALDLSYCQRLPDATMEGALREAAAAAYGVAAAEQIVVAAGSQAVIQTLPRLRPFSRVAVIGPTYAEHTAAWTNSGHQILPCETIERIGDVDVVVVVNPNNPDGRRHDPKRLLEVAATLAKKGGLLVVDEAFGDIDPDQSLAPHVHPGLVVLRSFGKFFGLAGLRLGFVICDPAMARLLRTTLGPWPVSGPALHIGRIALADQEWMEKARVRLVREAGLLDTLLAKAELSIAGGTALFRLINAPRAWALYEHLGQRGILVRPFAASPRWLRVGLPPGEEGRRRLEMALTDWRN
ncbi:threonine-phosphate decarboxylase CobD [Telmatospirillum siberiense]|uniref:threonine-phosphate decarboxylase n=1 Tax=Telmatospirillum siberiense TaxID=382514 RepID=A0A2N3PZQ8_9PROT|nr:threonine-phosphate decarboxylase CobD [Telmatospirillum siberiense]PKU25894.1 threonine-phosphate decarboxylase [Telmatospirillum siberiense]